LEFASQTPGSKLLTAVLNRQQATGNRQQATGNRQHYTLSENHVNNLAAYSNSPIISLSLSKPCQLSGRVHNHVSFIFSFGKTPYCKAFFIPTKGVLL
jgi:hypothetical protein